MNKEPKSNKASLRKKIAIACAVAASVYLAAFIGSIWWVIAQILTVPPLPPIDWTTQIVIGSKPLCGTWQIMTGASDSYEIYYVRLKAIAAVADDDVWAVGVKGNDAYFNHSQPKASPLTLHWDGVRWSEVPIPDSNGYLGLTLSSVTAVSKDDVWAGLQYSVYDPQPRPPEVFHWNGNAWSNITTTFASLIPSPTASGYGTDINSLWATSHDDIWAAGAFLVTKNGPSVPLMHWDGKAWSLKTDISSTLELTSSQELNDVTALSAKDAWAVGLTTQAAYYPIEHALALRWDGLHWKETNVPVPQDQRFTALSGVTMVSKDNIWAVGYSKVGASRKSTYIVHWDGDRWTEVHAPNTNEEGDYLSAVSTVGANDIIAVGQAESFQWKTLIEHWDGNQWSVIPIPSILNGTFTDVVTLPNGNIWAVGNYTSYDKAQTTGHVLEEGLVAHYIKGPCPTP